MAVGGDGADDVDEVHEPSAEQVSEGVGVVGENDLGHLRLGAGNGANGRVGVSRAHVVFCLSNTSASDVIGCGYNEGTRERIRRSLNSSFGNDMAVTQIALVQSPTL
jgi:hypothetical protein